MQKSVSQARKFYPRIWAYRLGGGSTIGCQSSRNRGKKIPDPSPTWERKHLDIPNLPDYNVKPDESFWKVFPSHYPTAVYAPVNIEILENLIKKCWYDWTDSERLTAQKALSRVKGEIPVKFSLDLPGINERNTKSAIENGAQITDALADWIRKKFVAGPFVEPHSKNSALTHLWLWSKKPR